MNTETTLAERIKLVVGDNVSAFSRTSGVGESLLRQYIAGSKPGLDKAADIAKAGGVSLLWLATGEGPMRPPAWQRQAEGEMVMAVVMGDEEATGDREERRRATTDLIREAKEDGRRAALEDFALIKVYDVRASAGSGAAIDQERVVTDIAFRRDWLAQEGLGTSGLAAVTADGDSMEPTIKDCSLLLLDTQQRELAGNRIYILRMDGHLYAKRLQRLTDGSIRVSSDNPAYADEVVGKEDTGNLDIIGRVVWVGRRL